MQGFNMGRYVPPEHEGLLSANALHKKPPQLTRAGAPLVRFEMPFPIWCTTCRPHPTLIGQGVRFNAEKRRTGAYHSTPVYTFRMRHPACGGAIEIRTDPARTTYAVESGARRRDAGDGGAADSLVSGSAEVRIATAREREAARGSAFANLEKTIEDREVLAAGKQRIGELAEAAGRHWDDPYERNRALRRAFRVGREERERDAAAVEELQDRLGFGLELLPATEEDAKRAALIDFGSLPEREDGTGAGPVDEILAQPLFGVEKSPARAVEKTKANSSAKEGKPKTKKLKTEAAAEKTKASLASEIAGNTRAAKDPFLDGWTKDSSKPQGLLPGLKRKRAAAETVAPREKLASPSATDTRSATALVEYDSDSG